jgi:hypothetical protein
MVASFSLSPMLEVCLQPKTDTPRPVKFKLFLLSCRPSNQKYQILS